MTNTVRIKRRVTGSAGAPSSLANAELAFNEVEDVLYYGKGTGGANGTATAIQAIGGAGAFATISSTQSISGNKTFTGDVVVPTQLTTDNSGKAANTAFVKSQGYLTANQTITISGDGTGSGGTSITLTLANSGVAAGTYTKLTVDSKGRATAGSTLQAADIPTLTSVKISDLSSVVQGYRLDQFALPTADVSFNSRKITGLAAPVGDNDAATKGYVDAVNQGLSVKDSVRVATTASITLSGLQMVDGINLASGDRVLVKNQVNTTENGIYAAAASGWSRTADADASSELTAGVFVFVNEGAVNATSGWVLTTRGVITLGTTSLTFAQFSGAGQISAGAGLTRTGSSIDVVGTANRITSNADSIDIASTYAGQTSINTLGTINTGTWNGTTIAVANGGTGATTASDARTNLQLGSMSTQNSNSVTITGGSIAGTTIDGGTF